MRHDYIHITAAYIVYGELSPTVVYKSIQELLRGCCRAEDTVDGHYRRFLYFKISFTCATAVSPGHATSAP